MTHATDPTPLLFRQSDPATSREAAANHAGAAGSNRAEIFAFLRGNVRPQNWTSAEIAHAISIDRTEAGRRMSELEQGGTVVRGPARKCEVKGTSMVTWFAKPYGGGRYRI